MEWLAAGAVVLALIATSSRTAPDPVRPQPYGGRLLPIRPSWRSKYGMRKGRIHMMGTDPDHRGKGIGRAALLAGISCLESRGLEVAELTVDSQNSEARSLYESVGFKVWATSTWYEKALV